MNVKGTIHAAARRLGFDVVKYPPKKVVKKQAIAPVTVAKPPAPAKPPASPYAVALQQIIDRERIKTVIDVGANQGQFARQLRRAGYRDRILSFEPVSSAAAVARASAESDPLWECRQFALGAAPGAATINVAANLGQSSSILPMLARHEEAAPHALYSDTETVEVRRLDDEVPATAMSDPVLLKIDTQGFEREVLAGAEELLAGPVSAVTLELSVVPLYEGQAGYWALMGLLWDRGFRLAHVVPNFSDPDTGEMLQFDGTFVRRELEV